MKNLPPTPLVIEDPEWFKEPPMPRLDPDAPTEPPRPPKSDPRFSKHRAAYEEHKARRNSKDVPTTEEVEQRKERIPEVLTKIQLSDVEKRVLQIDCDPQFNKLTQIEKAELAGIGVAAYRSCLDRPAYKAAKSAITKDAIELIMDARSQAARKMVKLINSENEAVALRACENILGDVLKEKTGTKEQQKLLVAIADMRGLTTDDLSRKLSERLRIGTGNG